MTLKLPTSLGAVFQPIELDHFPLPSLISVFPNDLISYIKDKEALLKSLQEPADAVVQRIAALVAAGDETDMFVFLFALRGSAALLRHR